MKKKAIILSVTVVAVVVIALLFVKSLNEEHDVDHQNQPDSSNSFENAVQSNADDSSNLASTEDAVENNIVSYNAEKVEVVLLPEAIMIGDGNPGSFYGNNEFSDVIPTDIHSFSTEEIPTKYDSRNVDGKSYVTSVKDQGYTYLCWTYAALGAVESDILTHYPEYSSNELNLSEKHLAYYNMHKAEGSVNGYIDDDYREFVNADNEEGAWIFDYDTNYIATGGVADFVISLLTAWKGPVYDKNDDAFTSIYGEKYLFEDNGNVPSPAYSSAFHVQNVNEISAGISNNTQIKQLIMEHGSVTAGICAEDKFWTGRNLSLYSDFNGEEIPTADHEVLIVGWDDEYSKNNFKIAPPDDGAWICRNSWGSKSGESGYFYLSYYDETTGINNVAAYDVAIKGDKDYYDNNYQAAGFITYMVSTLEDSDNYVTTYSASKNPYGMLYSASSEETLKAIGLMGLETYQQYEFDIYVNPDRDNDKISISDLENPDISFKGSAISGGYHTFELPEDVKLAAGDDFFVLVKPYTSGRLVFEKCVDETGKPNYDEWDNLTGSVHNCYNASGCSYYISEDGMSMKKQNDKDFFVKAYTVNQ